MEVPNRSLVKMTFLFSSFQEDTTKYNKQGETQYLWIFPWNCLNILPHYHLDYHSMPQ